MAVPVYVVAGAGAATATSSAMLSLTYPASAAAGYLFVTHVFHRTSTTLPTAPAGWTTVAGPQNVGSVTGRHWVYVKLAAGTEIGGIGFGNSGGTSLRVGRIYMFSGLISSTTIGSNYEGVNAEASAGSVTTIADTSVTTAGVNRLALNLVAVADDNAVASFTGETGGDWTEQVAEFATSVGSDGCIQLQGAAMAAAGVINGGNYAMAAADPWGVIGLALIGVSTEAAAGGATAIIPIYVSMVLRN